MENTVAKLLYSRADTAFALSISIRSVDYLISVGKLTTRRIGEKTLIPVSDVRDSLASITRKQFGPRKRPNRMKKIWHAMKRRSSVEFTRNLTVQASSTSNTSTSISLAGGSGKRLGGDRTPAVTLLAKRKTERLQRLKLPEQYRRTSIPFCELLDDALDVSRAENSEERTYNHEPDLKCAGNDSETAR